MQQGLWPMAVTAQKLIWCEAVINFHRKNSTFTDSSQTN